jgi:creatinine amidohydrolase
VPLARAAWPDIPRGALVLVPTGSTEQHGPHLPFDTDTTIATAVAEGVGARLSAHEEATDPRRPPVVVAPAVAYGASGEHQSFPGTVSIGLDVLQLVLIEVVRSLSTWAGRIVFVNGHGGNIAALAGAVARMRAEGHRVAWVPCGVAGGDAHAGRTETSVMLNLEAQAVDLTRAVVGNVAPVAMLLAQLAASGVGAVSPTGVLGDPTGASAAEGAAILECMVSGVIRRMSTADPDATGCLRDPISAGARG